MSAVRPTFVIVGAGLAGAKAAETLRAEGFDGRIVLVGAEKHRPYERPPLSKELLRGESDGAEAFVHAEAFYREHEIALVTGTRVTRLDAGTRELTLGRGSPIRYDRLLLATGSRPRRLRIPGSDLPGIHYLRTLDDNTSLRTALQNASRVAVVGAGWIGSEVAASARALGVEVALIDPAPVPLVGVLGPEVGAVYRDLHADHGVELHLDTPVEAFLGDEQVRGVRIGDGSEVPADVVVVGIGAEPRVELARDAGLDIDGGVVVDATLAASAPGVFAAGDIAAAWHPTLERRVRVEHWANAMHQGVTAAKNMLGAAVPYDRLPYFFSDQYDLGMEYSGFATRWDRVVFRGDRKAREFIAFWLANGRVVAAMNANVWDVTEPLQALIRSAAPVDPARLEDAGVPLDALVATDPESASA